MSSRFLCVPVTLSLAFLVPSIAMADTIDATSHVTAATIFSDRAIVTRQAKIHVPAGAHVVAVIDMPPGFDDASIRVQGKSTAGVKIGTVEVKHIYLNEQANAAEREKTAALETKNDDKAFREGEIAALKTREEFINRIVAGGANTHDKDGNAILDFAPEKWATALKTLQSEMNETQKELAAKNIAMRKLDAEIARIQNEMNQVRTSQGKERRDVQINVEADHDTDLELSMNYQTSGATWRSVYDARLETGTGALDLEQYGQVSQQTGEDWNDIDLTLSTSQPAFGSEMPRMSEWWVRLFQPVMQAYNGAIAVGGTARAKEAMMAQKAMPMSLAAPAPMADDAEIMEKKDALQQQAVVQSTEYAADFHVPAHVPLKSVHDSSKIFVANVHMKAGLAAQVSPRLTPQAYLFAKVTNDETYPLIPGLVSKYRDGSFIGNAPLALLRPGEVANLSFGVDDRVKVTYQNIHEEQSNPTLVVVGDMKTERQYQTKIQNLHKDPMVITVFEQYPVSADPDVKVEMLDDVTTQGYAEDQDKRQGVITWSGTYNPKEEKNLCYRLPREISQRSPDQWLMKIAGE